MVGLGVSMWIGSCEVCCEVVICCLVNSYQFVQFLVDYFLLGEDSYCYQSVECYYGIFDCIVIDDVVMSYQYYCCEEKYFYVYLNKVFVKIQCQKYWYIYL